MDEKMRKLVEEAETRCAAATPGPWTPGPISTVFARNRVICSESDYYDVRFIAFSRDAVPAFCAEVRRLDKENEDLRARISELECELYGPNSCGPVRR